jgi:thioredoxin-related protein
MVYFNINAQTLNWLSFAEAVELNKKNPKKILIDIYTDWCGWCKVMDKNTYTNAYIINYINKYYYAVKLNAEQKDTVIFQGHTFVNENKGVRSSHQLAQSLLNGKMSYPTTVFMNEKFEMLSPVAGYLKPEDIEPVLEFFALNKHLSMTYDQFKQNFKSQLPVSDKAVSPTK